VQCRTLVNKANGILNWESCARTDALRFDRTMPSFDLDIALGIVTQGSYTRHTADANELLEVLSHELGTAVTIELHGSATSVTPKWVLDVKLNDGLLFPVFEPPVARNPDVMLVHVVVAILPVIEFARAEAGSLDELLGRDLRPV
jgi:hypothetical protein